MSDEDDDSDLSPEEKRLWARYTRTVAPIRKHRPPARPGGAGDGSTKPRKSAGPARAAPPGPAGQPKRAGPPSYTPPRDRPKTSPLSGLDRRTSQRLHRGQIEVDARLDLHGHRRHEAHDALMDFLSAAAARGARMVLVITGKGQAPFARHTLHSSDYTPSPERTGVLRDAVAGWLNEPDFRDLVSGFQPAHPRHGGGGAFYVRLRRRG